MLARAGKLWANPLGYPALPLNFAQAAAPKLEGRKDMRISALVDYLESLGMGLEISALPKGSSAEREILLRV